MSLELSSVNGAPFTSQIYAHHAPSKTVNYLQDGLMGVDRLRYRGTKAFKTAIDKQISGFQLNGAAQYVVFCPVSPKGFENISNFRDAHYRGLRFMYIGGERTLIIKFGVSLAHELAHRIFVRCFEEKLREMGLSRELERIGAAGLSGPRSEKEADSAYKPRSRRFEDDWPTLVIECGVSESLARLQVDAQWWLENSAGDVKTAIVIAVSKAERRVHLEKWELADEPDPSDPSIFPPTMTAAADIIGEEVRISAKGVTKTSFVIDFTKTMLCKPPVGRPGGDNFTFSKEELVELADRVWDASQTRPASD
ncbi:hypothetical protein B9Z19DRAFT_1025468 [Tuber borchii]|uniref:Uncharacterized protein n=1 Tax=Tuber borchii TaxID=42251 RepID=A0A2T6ZS98_TUBBO|nr:hypothetical protein B9Z19DRAFT_1025468 [Tuber borchii]